MREWPGKNSRNNVGHVFETLCTCASYSAFYIQTHRAYKDLKQTTLTSCLKNALVYILKARKNVILYLYNNCDESRNNFIFLLLLHIRELYCQNYVTTYVIYIIRDTYTKMSTFTTNKHQQYIYDNKQKLIANLQSLLFFLSFDPQRIPERQIVIVIAVTMFMVLSS